MILNFGIKHGFYGIFFKIAISQKWECRLTWDETVESLIPCWFQYETLKFFLNHAWTFSLWFVKVHINSWVSGMVVLIDVKGDINRPDDDYPV